MALTSRAIVFDNGGDIARSDLQQLTRNCTKCTVGNMAKPRHKGAEQARNELPSLLEQAARGETTIITRRGRSVAALIPIDGLLGRARQKGLIDLIGSGKGLWGTSSQRQLRRLRAEWNR